MTIITNEDCVSSYGNRINSSHICATDTTNAGKDTCQKDSGGPMFLLENGRYTNNRYGCMLWYSKMSNNQIFCYCYRNTLVGVTSFGSGCGDPDYPGVYARVTEVKQWIQATVSGTQDSNCKLE